MLIQILIRLQNEKKGLSLNGCSDELIPAADKLMREALEPEVNELILSVL